MGRRIVRALGGVAWLAVCLTAVLLAATFLPTLFGYETFIVATGSMGRTMPVGSVALTRPYEARAISIGDVVSFRRAGRSETVTHRVVEVAREGADVVLTTKGDSATTADPEPIVVRGRIARVEYVVPLAGHLVRLARSPAGGVLLFLVPIIGLTLDRRTRRGRRRGRVALRVTPEELGWSATTFAFVRAAPAGSEPGG